jgi:DNA primase
MSDPVLELLNKNGLGYTVSGRDYLTKCLNPDHEDTNPSFRIDRISGVAHCFSCGFKTNIFKYFGIFTNPVPLRILNLKKKLQQLKATTEQELPVGHTPWTKPFRGISAQTLKHFKAFYTNQVEKLVDRIVFPIGDVTNRTQVFVGRHTLSNGNPRYLNYPSGVELPVYPSYLEEPQKSIVLVEGIFDMLNLYDKGLKNAVCCFGTNTLQNSAKQKLLPFKAQGVTHVYILFDGDEAGEKAAKQLKPTLEQDEFVVEIIKLPDGVDPGELDQIEVHSIKEYITK